MSLLLVRDDYSGDSQFFADDEEGLKKAREFMEYLVRRETSAVAARAYTPWIRQNMMESIRAIDIRRMSPGDNMQGGEIVETQEEEEEEEEDE